VDNRDLDNDGFLSEHPNVGDDECGCWGRECW